MTTKNVTAVAGSAPAYSAQRCVVVTSAYAAGSEQMCQHVAAARFRQPSARHAGGGGRGEGGGVQHSDDVVQPHMRVAVVMPSALAMNGVMPCRTAWAQLYGRAAAKYLMLMTCPPHKCWPQHQLRVSHSYRNLMCQPAGRRHTSRVHASGGHHIIAVTVMASRSCCKIASPSSCHQPMVWCCSGVTFYAHPSAVVDTETPLGPGFSRLLS